jgi:hypothetical protein
MQAAAAVIVSGALVATNGPPMVTFVTSAYRSWEMNTSSYKRRYGHWSILPVPARMRVNAVHAALLYTGKVLIVAGSGNDISRFNAGRFESLLFDPRTDKLTKVPTPSDMFCAGHTFLPDGKLLIGGGTTRYEVLHSQIQNAAGVITVTNSSQTAGTILAKGTIFVSATGQRYRSVTATAIPPARSAAKRPGRAARAAVTPSSTPLWVQALAPGETPAVRTPQRFTIEGATGRAAVAMEATAYSITRDEQTFWGSRKSYVFDPATERYEATSSMNLARWYPTLVRLINGKVLAVSGLDQFGRIIAGQHEEWDPKTRVWSVVAGLGRPFPTYPALFLRPSGTLFFTGSNAGFGPATAGWRTPGIWDPVTDAFKPVPGMRDPQLTETSSSVLLPPAQDQRYAIIGGGAVGDKAQATGRIDVIDLHGSLRWQPAGRLPQPTRYPEAVITPDDKVIVAGGSREYRGRHASDIFECHLFDPASRTLTRLAPATVGRDYHSEALLLPDGRIITLGGNPLYADKWERSPGGFEQRIEIYSPPYLYRGRRPRLTDGPQRLTRGGTGVFTTPAPAEIATARLLRPSAVTHVTDIEQRSVALSLSRTPTGVALTLPLSAGLLPSGWYMLFVTNRAGTPSVARWVHVE